MPSIKIVLFVLFQYFLNAVVAYYGIRLFLPTIHKEVAVLVTFTYFGGCLSGFLIYVYTVYFLDRYKRCEEDNSDY